MNCKTRGDVWRRSRDRGRHGGGYGRGQRRHGRDRGHMRLGDGNGKTGAQIPVEDGDLLTADIAHLDRRTGIAGVN